MCCVVELSQPPQQGAGHYVLPHIYVLFFGIYLPFIFYWIFMLLLIAKFNAKILCQLADCKDDMPLIDDEPLLPTKIPAGPFVNMDTEDPPLSLPYDFDLLLPGLPPLLRHALCGESPNPPSLPRQS